MSAGCFEHYKGGDNLGLFINSVKTLLTMYTFHSGGGWWDVGDCLEYCLKMTSIFLIQDNYEEDCNSVGR